jgi:predicted aldo/keto reductase-like oxidoreductase
MQKIRLGRTGLQVTKIGFGGIPIQRITEDEAVEVVRRAVDLGINWIDTANGYTVSEERIGKALREYPRDRVLLFTKGGGKSPEALDEQIQLSLRRLQTDVIDVYQFHGVHSKAWKGMLDNGAVDLVLDYRRKGVIRHVAASSHDEASRLEVMDHPAIEVVQWPFNFVMHGEAIKVLEKCRERDIGFIAMKPMGGGRFPNAGPCIRFLMQYPEVAADPGFEKTWEVEEIVGLVDGFAGLTEEDRRELAQLQQELGKRFCRRCGYCSPCPQGVSIVGIMPLGSFIKRFPPSRVFNEATDKTVASLDKCIECGECEEKCPYDLPIREIMRAEVENYHRLRPPVSCRGKKRSLNSS